MFGFSIVYQLLGNVNVYFSGITLCMCCFADTNGTVPVLALVN